MRAVHDDGNAVHEDVLDASRQLVRLFIRRAVTYGGGVEDDDVGVEPLDQQATRPDVQSRCDRGRTKRVLSMLTGRNTSRRAN